MSSDDPPWTIIKIAASPWSFGVFFLLVLVGQNPHKIGRTGFSLSSLVPAAVARMRGGRGAAAATAAVVSINAQPPAPAGRKKKVQRALRGTIWRWRGQGNGREGVRWLVGALKGRSRTVGARLGRGWVWLGSGFQLAKDGGARFETQISACQIQAPAPDWSRRCGPCKTESNHRRARRRCLLAWACRLNEGKGGGGDDG